jgi:hypothetical protein
MQFKRKPDVKYAWNSTFKAKPTQLKRVPLNKVSKKAIQRTKDYRDATFALHGEVCYICGAHRLRSELDCHHLFLRKNGDDPNFIFPVCNKECGCGGHNHLGKEGLLEVNTAIFRNLTAVQLETIKERKAELKFTYLGEKL